jgi:hypothetical protein
MPADPIHPDQLHGDQRFRADLVAYLDSLPVNELAELLSDLPSARQQPLGLGVLMIALNERLPACSHHKVSRERSGQAAASSRPCLPTGVRVHTRGVPEVPGVPDGPWSRPPDQGDAGRGSRITTAVGDDRLVA